MTHRFRNLTLAMVCIAGLMGGLFIFRFEKSKNDASVAAAPSADVPLVPPVIKITETTIFVGDREVAKTDTIIASTRIQKIDGLFAELKRIQASRRNIAGLPEHQTVIVDAAWNVPAVVLKSVYQTAAYASFDDVEFARTDGGVFRP